MGDPRVAYRHQPIGFLPEVSQLLGVSLELHAGCDAGQPVLDVLCRSLVHLHCSNTSIWFYRFFSCCEGKQNVLVRRRALRARFLQRITQVKLFNAAFLRPFLLGYFEEEVVKK